VLNIKLDCFNAVKQNLRSAKNKTPTKNYYISWGVRQDLPQILEIEQSSFQCPWTKEEFIKTLSQRTNVCLVIRKTSGTIEHDIVGYVIYELNKKYLNIINLAVHPHYVRFGIGSQLIDKLKRKLAIDKRRSLVAIISEYNLTGHLFFRANGFRVEHIIPNEFCDDKGVYYDGYCARWHIIRNM